MSPIDALPADQQAVLSLLLKQGRTYDDIAALLRIDRDAVRGRAFAAAETLVPEMGVDRDRRAQINDYLLGQQTASERGATREALAVLAPERAWGRALVAELQPLSAAPLPEIPPEEGEAPEAPAAEAAAEEPAPGTDVAEKEQDRESRLGLLLLLGGLAIVLIIVIVLVATGGSSNSSNNGPTASTPALTKTSAATTPPPATTPSTGPSTTPTTTVTKTTTGPTKTVTKTTTTPPKLIPLGSVNLAAPGGAKQPVGVAEIYQLTGKTLGANIVGTGLEPSGNSFAYAVWLIGGSKAPAFLGFSQVVKADGRLRVLADLPANVADYPTLALTKETVASPSKPGTIVLQGKMPNLSAALAHGAATTTTTTPSTTSTSG